MPPMKSPVVLCPIADVVAEVYNKHIDCCGCDIVIENLMTTTSLNSFRPSVSLFNSQQVSWDWGDGTQTLNNNSPYHTYSDFAPSHQVGMFNVNPEHVEVFNISETLSTSVDVSYFTKMAVFRCNYNSLSTLDLSNNTELSILSCYANNLTSLDISMLPELVHINLQQNPISSIDVSNNPKLTELGANQMLLTSLDISSSPKIEILSLRGNLLTSTSIDNILISLNASGVENGSFDYHDNPGETSLTASVEYDSLIAKGWSITGTPPSGTPPSGATEFPYTFPIVFV